MDMRREQSSQPSRTARWLGVAAVTSLAACAAGMSSVALPPLGANLTPSASTGAPVPLRFDPSAKVIRSTAADLPAASYLASQADRGAKIYDQTCGNCHGPGQLIGETFVNSWNDRRVYDLYALVRNTMPLDNPGGLKDGDYLDVVAYLMKANHQKASGMDSLKADTASLRKTKISVSP